MSFWQLSRVLATLRMRDTMDFGALATGVAPWVVPACPAARVSCAFCASRLAFFEASVARAYHCSNTWLVHSGFPALLACS